MSEEVSSATAVVLEFRLRNLQAAEGICKQIIEETKKASNLSAEARREIIGRARSDLAELRAQKEQVLNLQKALRAGQSVGPLDQLREPLRVANQVREKGQAVLNVLQGSTGGVAGLAALAGGPVAASIAALVIPLVNEAFEAMERKREQERRLDAVRLEVRFRELELKYDYAGRLDRDPAFARGQAHAAFRQTVEEEAARARAGAPPLPFDEDF